MKGKQTALESLLDETRMFAQSLRSAEEALHEGNGLAGGLRGVLAELDRTGPSTVPQIARARDVSRQHIQVIVNRLVAIGLAEMAANPRHRKSNLVRLTAEGERMLTQIRARERRLRNRVAAGVSKKGLRSAAATLRTVRELL